MKVFMIEDGRFLRIAIEIVFHWKWKPFTGVMLPVDNRAQTMQ